MVLYSSDAGEPEFIDKMRTVILSSRVKHPITRNLAEKKQILIFHPKT